MKRPGDLGMKTFSGACASGLSEFVSSVSEVPYGLWCLTQVIFMPIIWPACYLHAAFIQSREKSDGE